MLIPLKELDKMIRENVKLMRDAGADMIFPEAMKDESEFEKVRKAAFLIFVSQYD